jgi:hypothetical protein
MGIDFAPLLLEVVTKKRVAVSARPFTKCRPTFPFSRPRILGLRICSLRAKLWITRPPKEDRKLAKTNYQFEKRKRESVKKAKKEEKRLRKQAPQDPEQPPAETKQ